MYGAKLKTQIVSGMECSLNCPTINNSVDSVREFANIVIYILAYIKSMTI
jgi:hypothetical protein